MLPIYVVNNYGQFNHLIHRSLRDLDIEVSMVPNSTPALRISEECRGIILGGGPTIERAGNCSQYLDLGLPGAGDLSWPAYYCCQIWWRGSPGCPGGIWAGRSRDL